jgi:hypothetical protein
LYRYGLKTLGKQGYQLAFMMPDPRFVPIFKLFPTMQCASFPLWSLPLPLPEPLFLAPQFTVRTLDIWDERVDHLWRETSKLFQCAAVRDRRFLRWKLDLLGGFTLQAIERDGALVSLVASRKKGDCQWLICDLLAADHAESLRAALVAACNLASQKAIVGQPEGPLRKVAVLATASFEPVLRDLGFTRDDYDFTLVVEKLDPAVPKDAVAPAKWYVSAND